jgi:1-acyl-sn-glycerol-3-phosphate acyltransferase
LRYLKIPKFHNNYLIKSNIKELFYKMVANILQRAFWLPARLLLIFFFHFKVEGLENLKNLPKGKGVIFAANHGSHIDSVLIPAALPINSPLLPVRYLALEILFKFPYFLFAGLPISFFGAIPVKRGLGDLGLALKKPLKILRSGGTVGIFPEGRRTKIGDLKTGFGQIQRGYRGVAFLARETGLPVVPVALKGNFRALTLNIFLLRKRKLKVVFGAPIFISKELALEEGVDRIMREIERLLKT